MTQEPRKLVEKEVDRQLMLLEQRKKSVGDRLPVIDRWLLLCNGFVVQYD
ncbi:MAG: hypothetical protein NTU79_05265 [Planctomycetota bacterium]|nr:hypothetical protein [Planctomycetota bacterium]